MEKYTIALNYKKPPREPGFWVAVVAQQFKPSSELSLFKVRHGKDPERAIWYMVLNWPNEVPWQLSIVLTVYLSMVAILMIFTSIIDVKYLVAIQYACTIHYLFDFSIAITHMVMTLPAWIIPLKRSKVLLYVDLISLLPITLVYMLTVSNVDPLMACYLSLNIFLRGYRLPQFFSKQSTAAGIAHLRMRILEYVLYFFLSFFIFSFFWNLTDSHIANSDWFTENITATDEFFVSFYFATITFTNTGLEFIRDINPIQMTICTIAMVAGFALTTGILIGAIMSELLLRERIREMFRKEFIMASTRLQEIRMKKEQAAMILKGFRILWHYMEGTPEETIFKVLPNQFKKEIFFDLNYGLLNRSLVFNPQETSFLRSIAVHMRNKTYLPGDDIVSPYGIWPGMLCIVSGVVEVLSEENDDSPLISFTEGTIIGEICLFFPIPIILVMRAATIVELQVLRSVDFNRVAVQHRDNLKSMRDIITERLINSREIDINPQLNDLDPEDRIVTRRRKLAEFINEAKFGKRLKFDTELLTASKLHFRQMVRSLYVIVENIPKVKCLPFSIVKGKSYILHPNTPFTETWKFFMFWVVTSVVFYYPYCVAFVRTISLSTYGFMLVVQILYILDLIIECITAVPRDDNVSYITNLREIILSKLKSPGFYLNVIATYDLAAIAPLIYKRDTDLDYPILYLSLNKLLKIWTIPVFFNKLETSLRTNILFIRIIKEIYIIILALHFVACVLYLEACPNDKCIETRWFSRKQKEETENKIPTPYTKDPYLASLYLALMCTLTAGFGSIRPAGMVDVYTFTFFILFGLIVLSYCLGELSATFKHVERKKTEYQERLVSVQKFMQEHDLPKSLRARVKRFFQTQWMYDEGHSIKSEIDYNSLPSKFKHVILSDKLHSLRAVKTLKNANPGFMTVLAQGCTVRVLPQDEVVVYAGCSDKEMYILQSGYCRIHYKKKAFNPWIIGPSTSFGDIDMIRGLPMMSTVKTLTFVKVISIEYSTYLRAVTQYPGVKEAIENAIQKYQLDEAFDEPTSAITSTTIDVPNISRNVRGSKWSYWFTNSFINVPRFDRLTNKKFRSGYNSWGIWKYLGYLFLPYTIKPDSTFVHLWVSLRVITLLMVGFITPIFFTFPAHLAFLMPCVLILLLLTWIDIYLLFHLAYYDARGILVFHPAKTATRYFKGNFALDFVIAIPFYWILELSFPSVHRYPNLVYNGPGLIKVLQCYKALQAAHHLESDITRRSLALKIIKYVPTVLILTNVLTGLLILTECHTDSLNTTVLDGSSISSVYQGYILQYCRKGGRDHIETELTREAVLDLYIITYYWITAVMTSCGLGDIVPHDGTTLILCIIMVIVGIFIYASMFASIASGKVLAHHHLSTYRSKILHMMKFMKATKVPPEIKKRLYHHYEYNWFRTSGFDPQRTLAYLHTSLKQDIFDQMYERTIHKTILFRHVDKSFMRAIGKYIDEIYFLKGETIVQYKHLQEDLYIIYSGKVQIFSSDGRVLMTVGDGGVFGNLTSQLVTLSNITAITDTKVELMRMRSIDFQRMLSLFPTVKEKIEAIIKNHPDFVPPVVPINFETSSIHADSMIDLQYHLSGSVESRLGYTTTTFAPSMFEVPEVGQYYLKGAIYLPSKAAICQFVIMPDSWLNQALNIIVVSCAYISTLIATYMIAFQDFSVSILVSCYLIDFIFFFKIYCEYHRSSFNKYGEKILRTRHIRMKYMRSFMFYVDIFANAPLDFVIFIFALFFKERYLILSFIRLNRIVRVYYIYDYYKSKTNSLMTNLIIVELGSVCVWVSGLLHIYTCLWYVVACPLGVCHSESWIKHIEFENKTKTEMYIASLYYIATISTTTGYGDISPKLRSEIMLTIFFMVTSHFALVLCSVGLLAVITVYTMNFSVYEERIKQLKRDLIRQKISMYELEKVWKYLQLIWSRDEGRQMPVFLERAPPLIRCDVFTAMYGKHLERSYLFSGLEETFLRQLIVHFERYVFFPGNYIVHQGVADNTMYFIHSGEISVLTIHTNLMESIHHTLKENDQFGLVQGMNPKEEHFFSYRAETEVEILTLTFGRWQYLFKYFPEIKGKVYSRLETLKESV